MRDSLKALGIVAALAVMVLAWVLLVISCSGCSGKEPGLRVTAPAPVDSCGRHHGRR